MVPGDNLRRYTATGNYIAKHRPPVIVQLGDFADMASLSSYDAGKKEFVFQNVEADIECYHQAEAALFEPIFQVNKYLVSQKKAKYQPLYVKLIGNHEYRLKKLLEYEPRWQSSYINMQAFNTRLPINEVVVPFMDWISVDGIYYSHYFASGVMNRPVSNARMLLAKKSVSCIQGHAHTYDYASLSKPNGSRINGIIAGCLLDPEYRGFGGVQVDAMYWSGLSHLHDVKDGDFDLEMVGINRLLKEYT